MSNERILIVEDDVDVAAAISAILQSRGYVIVSEATSGEEAIEQALRHEPDLVLDIQLAGDWDGVDTARALREKRDVAVLYMTASAGNDTLARAKATIQGRLFEPDFSTKQRGSGLGLATAYSIIKKHDGLLTVDSRIGEGATFRELLPVAAAAPEGESTPSSSERIDGLDKGRVLVIDDESAVRAAMSVILTDFGFEVTGAANGAQALDLFERAKQRSERFDVVLLDLTVRTGMGGLETLAKLRELDAKICVIATSGYAPDPVLATPQKDGFFGSLPKPYRREDLGMLVQRALQRRRTLG